jgi:hypothetical protein
MSKPLPAYKRQALEKRKAQLIAEYEAASAQRDRTLSAVDRARLDSEIAYLDQEIQEVDSQLGEGAVAPALSEETAKVPIGRQAPVPGKAYGTGNQWAVIVGADTYEDKLNYGSLHVCVKDAKSICSQFLANGYDAARIRVLTDDSRELPTRANVVTALQAVARATERDDLLVFYYSGHGSVAEGECYLVGRDGRYLTLADTAVPVSRIKEIMKSAPARAKVVILDACHSGADIGGKGPQPMTAEFIRRVFEQAAGLAILSSCTKGEVSYEWQAQERSVFTHYLLEALRGEADRDGKGFVSVQDAGRHVTDGVKLWASQRNVSQTPTLECAVTGELILARYRVKGEG